MFSSTFSASAGADIADFNFLIFAITNIDPSISFCCYYKQKKNPPCFAFGVCLLCIVSF